ncbi:hypothetical protein BD811P3_00003 [Bifidobacterium phage BD811P3]|nr:hypothetical protein BD811P3_00003 [Bifidobacterium phage BD811P3]
MVCDDMYVASFESPFEGGDVRLWYCPSRQLYVLRYAVRFCDRGVGQAVCTYDAGSYKQVADMLNDAIYIARLSLKYRN